MKTYDTASIIKSLEYYYLVSVQSDGRWYEHARKELRQISEKLDVPYRIVCGVCAILSPRNKWDNNVSDTVAIIGGYLAGLDVDRVSVHTFTDNKYKAWLLMHDYSIDDAENCKYIKGQKVRAFWRALCGDDYAAVIDTWMVVASGLSKDERLHRNNLYNIVAACLEEIADRYDIPVTVLQARIWCAVRRDYGYIDHY